MRVLAARFRDRDRALAALGVLQRRLGLAEDEAAIAPLGTPGEGDEGEDTLLAGRFPEDETATVRGLLNAGGGVVVADVDEAWTRPRSMSVEPATVDAAPGAQPRARRRDARARVVAAARLARQPIVQ